jgi:hypothetical protein
VHDLGNGVTQMAITPEDMGFSRNSEIAFIHSHPDDGHFNTPTEEYKSMGWRLYSNI